VKVHDFGISTIDAPGYTLSLELLDMCEAICARRMRNTTGRESTRESIYEDMY